MLAAIQGGSNLRHVESKPKLPSLQDNLLSAIKGGKVLRKVDAAALAPAKKVDPKADFLSAIKSGSHKAALRRVEVAETKPTAEEAKSEIADILARRMVIAAESESDGSDSDGDWDD